MATQIHEQLVTPALIKSLVTFNKNGANAYGILRGNIPDATIEIERLARSLTAGNTEPFAVTDLAGYLIGRGVAECEAAAVRDVVHSGKLRKVKEKAPKKSGQKPAATRLEELRAGHLPYLPISNVIAEYKALGLDRNRAWGQLMTDVHLLPKFVTDVPKNAGAFFKLW